MEVKISCKSMAKRRAGIQSISYQYENPMHTVGDFLAETVRMQVAQYRKRQEDSEVLKILSKEEIEERASGGKIGFGRIFGERKPDVEKAIQTALECFEDGIVVLFVDGNQMSGLGDEIPLHEGSEVTFVRMTMLAGRMW